MSYDLLFQRAIEYHQNGDFEHAEPIYRQILETVPHHPDILNLLGLIAQAKNIHQEAINLFYQAIQADNTRAQFYFNLGISLHLWNKPYEALEAFEKSAQLAPNTKEVWFEIGNIHHELNQKEQANFAYKKALELDNEYINVRIAQIMLNNSNDNAISELTKLQQSYPNEALIDLQLGTLYFQQQNFPLALSHITKAANNLPTNEEANSLLGVLLLKNNQIQLAKEAFEYTLEIAPNNITAHINLGNIETQNQNYPLAEKYYKRAIELDRKNFDAHHNYATLLYHQNRLSEALEEYRHAIIINPKSYASCNNLGLILRGQQDYEEALGLFFNAFQLAPNQEEISVNIAETLIELYQKSSNLALKIAQNWLQQYPDNIFAQHTLASFEGSNHSANDIYAQKLFDNFANNYEKTISQLDYQLPQKIHQILGNISGTILDLGCGTGLIGEAISSPNNTLIGVDISANMLQLAQQKNIYKALHHQDISQFMKHHQKQFDYIIAGDVFCYLSDLSEIIRYCSPSPLCFSIECNQDNTDYTITPTGRYKHSPLYIKQLLNKFGYTQVIEYPLSLRNENHQPVAGTIFVATP